MRKNTRATETLRGATWSALDKIMISPLVSKVKRAHNLTVLKLTAANCDQNHCRLLAHTRVHQTLKTIDTPHQGCPFTVETPHDVAGVGRGRLYDEKVAQFP